MNYIATFDRYYTNNNYYLSLKIISLYCKYVIKYNVNNGIIGTLFTRSGLFPLPYNSMHEFIDR